MPFPERGRTPHRAVLEPESPDAVPVLTTETLRNARPIGLALTLSAIGGVVADALTMPLPWMLGPMFVCLVGAILGLPIKGPMRLRPLMVMVLGVMLGSGFSPAMLDQMGAWVISLGMLILYVAVIGMLAYPYFRKVAGYDPITAYFSAMPGGLNEMMVVGAAMGGDDRKIVLTHATRVLIAVFVIPIWFRVMEDLDMSDRSQFGISILDSQPFDLAVLALCIAVGYPLATILRMPAKMLVGPMLVSAAVHLAGITSAQPPFEIVNLAQWIIGTVIGCRFAGIRPAEILRMIRIGFGATILMLCVTAAFAVTIGAMTSLPPELVVLAYAPGGLAEMTLVALALGADVAFVATHHVIRIAYVVIAAPIFFKFTGLKPLNRNAAD